MVRCINVDNGAELWKVSIWGSSVAVADGYLVTLNDYDNQLYCFGKGQTATTVLAPQLNVPNGDSVLITGTVSDQSAGAKGTPAISDDDMRAWMEYTYMQQSKPAAAKGVPVKLTATDPNGNNQDIGVTTSDAMGNYAIQWTPSISGMYKVTASFEGTNSYFASAAETTFVVSKPLATAMPTAAPSAVAGSNIVPLETFYAFAAVMVILMIVVIAVVILRKK